MRYLIMMTALCAPVSVAAQDVFEATYVVQQGGKEIGREHLVLRAGQPSSGAGSRIELDSKYAGAEETVRGVLTRGSDGLIDALQLEVRRSSGTESIRAATRGNRVFITTSAQGARGGRELPANPSTVLLDEQLLTLLVIVPELGTAAGARLSAIYPRTGRRASFTATRASGPRGAVIELTGDIAGRMLLDADGRLDRLELDSGVSLSRLPS
jgi:hypothetical protein